jgi:hypothetical protein
MRDALRGVYRGRQHLKSNHFRTPNPLLLVQYILFIYLLLHCFGRRPRSTSICKIKETLQRSGIKTLPIVLSICTYLQPIVLIIVALLLPISYREGVLLVRTSLVSLSRSSTLLASSPLHSSQLVAGS